MRQSFRSEIFSPRAIPAAAAVIYEPIVTVITDAAGGEAMIAMPPMTKAVDAVAAKIAAWPSKDVSRALTTDSRSRRKPRAVRLAIDDIAETDH